jgi:oligopeptidase B
LITPFSIVDFHMETGEWELKKEYEIPTGYDKAQYVTEHIHASTPDGKQVPISIVYKKELKKDGQNPTVLYGYGAYGASSDAVFNANLLSLLDRGFIYAIGHVRGGSELGRAIRGWQAANKFLYRFCRAEHLIKMVLRLKSWRSSAALLAGFGVCGPCGGTVQAAFQSPFLDVITSMSGPTIPLTTLNTSAKKTKIFDYMMSYSPYDNIHPVPHASHNEFNDPRVYWERSAAYAERKRG